MVARIAVEKARSSEITLTKVLKLIDRKPIEMSPPWCITILNISKTAPPKAYACELWITVAIKIFYVSTSLWQKYSIMNYKTSLKRKQLRAWKTDPTHYTKQVVVHSVSEQKRHLQKPKEPGSLGTKVCITVSRTISSKWINQGQTDIIRQDHVEWSSGVYITLRDRYNRELREPTNLLK